ncbi:hypothetical protein D1BOALGB6SA_2732 [Olavius sp. associated proteobacterium Delta 1]|nr:hypothetical protein D1BOALGB6SA_2732 [Olavius sp. associated proteobacterium Delta 1]
MRSARLHHSYLKIGGALAIMWQNQQFFSKSSGLQFGPCP